MNELFARALCLEKPWEIARVEFHAKSNSLDIHLDFPKGSVFACPKCGREVKAYDTIEKRWRHMNFLQYECRLVARVPRTDCPQDGALMVNVPWARKGADFTLLFESLSMALCREMPINTVARLMKASGNKLWRMVKHYVREARKGTSYSGLKSLGVDETSARKGHDYITIGVDIGRRRTVSVVEGKGAEALKEMRNDLIGHGCDTDKIERISIDMSPAFISGAGERFPNASVVFDRFHVMKVINEAVDRVRRAEAMSQAVLRKTRYLWLKNRANMKEKEQRRLAAIESMPRLNLRTVRAMHIRENFQLLYAETDRSMFERGLKKWYFWATHSRIEEIKEAAGTIKRHWDGVVAWAEHKISNGLLEGFNSLIQAAKAKARGYRTFETFSTIVFLLTGKLDFSKTGLPT